MNRSNFEPWRKRLAESFDRRPDIQITRFSTELGKNKDYIARLIHRGTANPPPNLLIEICDKIGVSAGFIVSGETTFESKGAIVRDILEADEEKFRKIAEAYRRVS